MTSVDGIPTGGASGASGLDRNAKDNTNSFAKIRLDGPRFRDGRLPISALVELERYERLVRDVAAAEWRADHPGRSNLPRRFRSSFHLVITSVEDGSAIPVLERESSTTPYEGYYSHAAETVNAAFDALVTGVELPRLFDWTSSADFRAFGDTLKEDEAIELRPNDDAPIRYTAAVRREVAARLTQESIIEDGPPEIAEGAVAGRLVALDAEDQSFRLRHPVSALAITGRYSDPELTADLRAVLDSSAVAPVVRVTGHVLTSRGAAEDITANFVELFAVDGGPYSRRLIELATLSPGWLDSADGTSGEIVEFTALEAARDLLRALTQEGLPLPGIFPMEDGGVQLEWASPDQVTSVEVSPDVHFDLFNLKVAERVTDEYEASDIEGALDFLQRVLTA